MEEYREYSQSYQKYKGRSQIAVCCAVLAALNVLVFLLELVPGLGNRLLDRGAFSAFYLLKQDEWYRIITAMFLHADAEHLMNSVVLLYLGGEIVEKSIGKWRFLVLYFVSGLCGHGLSAAYEVVTGNYYESIGASGAVFGLVGGLLFLVIVKRGRAAQISLQRMVFMVALSLYSGFRSLQTNNAAHIGGLISGFLLTFLLCMIGRENRRNYNDKR